MSRHVLGFDTVRQVSIPPRDTARSARKRLCLAVAPLERSRAGHARRHWLYTADLTVEATLVRRATARQPCDAISGPGREASTDRASLAPVTGRWECGIPVAAKRTAVNCI